MTQVLGLCRVQGLVLCFQDIGYIGLMRCELYGSTGTLRKPRHMQGSQGTTGVLSTSVYGLSAFRSRTFRGVTQHFVCVVPGQPDAQDILQRLK